MTQRQYIPGLRHRLVNQYEGRGYSRLTELMRQCLSDLPMSASDEELGALVERVALDKLIDPNYFYNMVSTTTGENSRALIDFIGTLKPRTIPRIRVYIEIKYGYYWNGGVDVRGSQAQKELMEEYQRHKDDVTNGIRKIPYYIVFWRSRTGKRNRQNHVMYRWSIGIFNPNNG